MGSSHRGSTPLDSIGNIPVARTIKEALHLFGASKESKVKLNGPRIPLDEFLKTGKPELVEVAQRYIAEQSVQLLTMPNGSESLRVLQQGRPYIVMGAAYSFEGVHYGFFSAEVKPGSRFGRTIVLPTGMVKEGETCAEAARREFRDECGVSLSSVMRLTQRGGVEEAPSQHEGFAGNFVYGWVTDPLVINEAAKKPHEPVYRVAIPYDVYIHAAQIGDHVEMGSLGWLLSAAQVDKEIGELIRKSFKGI